MHSTFKQQPVDDALQVIELARPLVEGIARRDRDLASQVRRAFSSVALNLAEAAGSAGGNARLRFETARGSLYEARAGLRVAVAWGFVSASACAAALEAGDRLGARLYGLARR
jgi:four helix bundle protein